MRIWRRFLWSKFHQRILHFLSLRFALHFYVDFVLEMKFDWNSITIPRRFRGENWSIHEGFFTIMKFWRPFIVTSGNIQLSIGEVWTRSPRRFWIRKKFDPNLTRIARRFSVGIFQPISTKFPRRNQIENLTDQISRSNSSRHYFFQRVHRNCSKCRKLYQYRFHTRRIDVETRLHLGSISDRNARNRRRNPVKFYSTFWRCLTLNTGVSQ